MEKLFLKFVNNTIEKEEFDRLLEFVKNPESKEEVCRLFDTYWVNLDVDKKAIQENADYEAESLFYHLMNQIDHDENKSKKDNSHSLLRRLIRNDVFKVAATILLTIGVFYFYQSKTLQTNKVVVSEPIIESNAIVLTLGDGTTKIISEEGEDKIINEEGAIIGSQKGNQLSYSKPDSHTKIEKLVYNKLTVPYGNTFALELSDGTKVTLNAGTTIKYPVRFLKGLDRNVFLTDGEAYFEVTKDKKHPFIVNTDNRKIEVLGTAFNVSNYPEDEAISTVLVEGAVRLYDDELSTSKEIILLTPGHEAAWSKSVQKMFVKAVDTRLYTAWKDGFLLFKKATYGDIIKKLERHYDVVIENHYQLLDSQVYTATFNNKVDKIEDVLESFKEDTPFNYTRVNNKIIITE